MNQKLLSGFTAAMLLSTFGIAPSGYADQAGSTDLQSGENVSELGVPSQATLLTAPPSLTSGQAPAQAEGSETRKTGSVQLNGSESQNGSELQPAASQTETPDAAPDSPNVVTPAEPSTSQSLTPSQSSEQSPPAAIKVGEYQSQERAASPTVATIQPHLLQGRQAATLYVRNIPVLTFLGSAASASTSDNSDVKVASVQDSASSPLDKTAETQTAAPTRTATLGAGQTPVATATPVNPADSRDPVWRATTTAARLNQLHRDSINADEIKIAWNPDRQRYVITANGEEVIALDADTVLPDTVESSAGDLLQATNRIRRQMGNAAPLSTIEGDPNGVSQVNLGPVSLRISGYASWYGPGFDGNYSASGEVFNQNALTAAHPSLPFGTQVRVTNVDNGESVVVRINDRGPYAHDRVIDLSAGAARVIGLIQSGVAPVSLEVLNSVRTASN
jgi:rare lipoprotein A